MKAKKVTKTFTVDEGVYNWLVEKLKEADIGIGVSNLLDGYLKYIYQSLSGVLNYVKKNKIDLPFPYIVHKVLDDHTLFYMVDWEVVEKLGTQRGKDYKKMVDDDTRIYVEGLREEYEEKYQSKWRKKPFRQISKLDRSDK